MSNTLPRAHVVGHTHAPIPADPDPKIVDGGASDDNETDRVIEIPIPISRKDKRKLKKQKRAIELLTPSDTENEASLPSKSTFPSNSPKKKRAPVPTSTPLSLPQLLDAPMVLGNTAAQKAYPLLICSIGNPGSVYAHTLHSAGHFLTTYIAARKSYRPFAKGLFGLVAYPDNTTFSFGPLQGYRKESGGPPEDDWTFWQSTTLMNVSGPSVRKAWTEFSKRVAKEGLEGRLVVVHDELESALGKVSVKDGGASAKGHNGLKSCQASLGGIKWWRVGVGIGRPESREPTIVSKYVLRKITRSEEGALEKSAVGVVDALRSISEGKK